MPRRMRLEQADEVGGIGCVHARCGLAGGGLQRGAEHRADVAQPFVGFELLVAVEPHERFVVFELADFAQIVEQKLRGIFDAIGGLQIGAGESEAPATHHRRAAEVRHFFEQHDVDAGLARARGGGKTRRAAAKNEKLGFGGHQFNP